MTRRVAICPPMTRQTAEQTAAAADPADSDSDDGVAAPVDDTKGDDTDTPVDDADAPVEPEEEEEKSEGEEESTPADPDAAVPADDPNTGETPAEDDGTGQADVDGDYFVARTNSDLESLQYAGDTFAAYSAL